MTGTVREEKDGATVALQQQCDAGQVLAGVHVRSRLRHRIGGLEKDFLTGNVSYDPDNHERMVRVRAAKVQGIAKDSGDLDLCGETSGDVLILGWGGTFGALRQATEQLQAEGKKVSHVHLRWVFPFNDDLGPLLKTFKQVLVCELNTGQMRTMPGLGSDPAAAHIDIDEDGNTVGLF